MGVVLRESLSVWWPEVILSGGALLTVIAGAWSKRAQPALALAWLSLIGAALALGKTPSAAPTETFYGFILCDAFSAFFRAFALGATALVLLMAAASTKEVRQECRGEYFALLLFVCLGLMLMAEANHLIMAYLSMELVSLSSYLLTGLVDERRSAEAALKYVLFGALTSAIMLFGISLIFGLTGTLSLPALLKASYRLIGPASRAALLGIVLMLAGLAFKVSMVPFHQWTPDVYEGAPVPVAALLSVGPKAAGLALLIRLTAAFGFFWATLAPLLIVLTMVTMTTGNVVALLQTNIKRLLAYSTIGQVGYMLIGLSLATEHARHALLVYLAAYFFMNLGAFACAVAVCHDTGSESLEAFQGLSVRSPGLAALCAIFFLSLAGLPPLFGFVGKFLLFGSALDAHQTVLAVVAAVNSAIALYYYALVIRRMYFDAPRSFGALTVAFGLRLAIAVCVVATILFGLYPAPVLAFFGLGLSVNLL